MAIEPNNTLWKRERQTHHGGAIRHYMKDPEDDGFPRGPNASPNYCAECDASDSQYNSASPASTSWYISSRDSSPVNGGTQKTTESGSHFHMSGQSCCQPGYPLLNWAFCLRACFS